MKWVRQGVPHRRVVRPVELLRPEGDGATRVALRSQGVLEHPVEREEGEQTEQADDDVGENPGGVSGTCLPPWSECRCWRDLCGGLWRGAGTLNSHDYLLS